MIEIDTDGKVGVMIGTCRFGPVIAMVPAWSISDEGGDLTVVACHDPVRGKAIADRVVELLERHGLVDVPDNAEGVA